MAKVSTREVVLFGMLGAMTFAWKYVMSGMPNIEPVRLMVMLFAVVFVKKWVYPVYVYVAMEIMVFGIGLWNINYLYIWAILAMLAYSMRSIQSPLAWATLSGVFGLAFGALCGIVDVPVGGVGYAVAKWISGIPADITHCVGNFCIALLLFKPIRNLLEKLSVKTR